MVSLVVVVSINFIQSLRDMFIGLSSGSVNMTVKWDGVTC